MKNFYIYANQTKDDSELTAQYIRDYIHLKGGVCHFKINDKVEAIIVLGGDGTMLRAAREYVGYHIPFIGVNLGTLGYMTEVDKEEIGPAIDNLMAGNFDIEPRMMLSGIPIIFGQSSDPQIALNDIVINRAGPLHVINFNIYVNGSLLSSYHADGMIISTPTGSTAYNLSAGGPIVEPRARLIMMTPVCSHTLVNNRTIILAEDDVIDIEIGEYKPTEEQVVNASFDGRYPVQLNAGDKIRVIRADKSTKIIKLGGASFLDTLHKKMGIC